jgi:hypothetical protein
MSRNTPRVKEWFIMDFLNLNDYPRQANVKGMVLSKSMLIVMQWIVFETCFIGLPQH